MHGRLLFRRELVVACACGCVRSIDGEGVNWVGVGFGAWCAAVNSGRESHAIHGGIYSGDAVGNGWMGDDSALGGRVCRVQAAGATCGCTRRRRRWRRKAGRGGAQPRGPATARAPTSPFRHFAIPRSEAGRIGRRVSEWWQWVLWLGRPTTGDSVHQNSDRDRRNGYTGRV